MALNKSLVSLLTLFFLLWLISFSFFHDFVPPLDRDFVDLRRHGEKIRLQQSSMDPDMQRSNHRKLLKNSQLFDFTPFKGHHRKHVPIQPEPGPAGGSKIDPLYGVENRVVPTGPNPLHH